LRWLALGLLALAMLVPVASARSQAGEAPSLELVRAGVTEGHALLRWASPTERGRDEALPVFELQLASTADFAAPEVAYRGVDLASFRSGLPRGEHFFRVRQRPAAEPEAWSPWSPAVLVEVRPYSLAIAGSLFAVGALLVASIIVYLFLADRRVRREETA